MSENIDITRRRAMITAALGVTGLVLTLSGCTVTPPRATVTVGAGLYSPLYYDGYTVFYDDVGVPYYYRGGVRFYVPRTYGRYDVLRRHYYDNPTAYRHWHRRYGTRWRGYRDPRHRDHRIRHDRSRRVVPHARPPSRYRPPPRSRYRPAPRSRSQPRRAPPRSRRPSPRYRSQPQRSHAPPRSHPPPRSPRQRSPR